MMYSDVLKRDRRKFIVIQQKKLLDNTLHVNLNSACLQISNKSER